MPTSPPAMMRALLIRLWREQIAPHRALLAVIFGLTLIMAASQALYPLVMGQAIDRFGKADDRILYQLPALVIIVTSVKSVAQYFQTVLVQRLVLTTVRGLQERMFACLTLGDLARVEREAPAALATRFTSDAGAIREAIGRAVGTLGDAVKVVGLVGSMIYIDWKMSLLALILFPLAAVPIQRIGKRIRRNAGNMQERVGETATLLNESLAQARTVRAYQLEQTEITRANSAFLELYRALMRINRGRSRIDPLLEVIAGTAIALVFGVAGWQAARSGQTIGDFTGFLGALMLMSQPLRAMGNINAALQEGYAGLARVYEIIDAPITIREPAHAIALPDGHGRVEFDHVAFTYPDGRHGLHNLSFVAEPGLTIALVGPSGGGKSTALALIPRLHDARSGQIRIDGADVRTLTLSSLRHAIAYVGQDSLLFDDTIAANIAMGRPGASQAEIAEAAEAAAARFIADLPEGFATRVGPGGQRLSGGQRQRVALARALLRNPRILLLDEATSALDTESESLVQQALARLRRGRTTIVVAHRLSTVRDADLVVAMADGEAVEQGTHAELLAQDGLYARLVRSQALAQ